MAVVTCCPFPQCGSTETSIRTLELCIERLRCYGTAVAVGQGNCDAHPRRPRKTLRGSVLRRGTLLKPSIPAAVLVISVAWRSACPRSCRERKPLLSTGTRRRNSRPQKGVETP